MTYLLQSQNPGQTLRRLLPAQCRDRQQSSAMTAQEACSDRYYSKNQKRYRQTKTALRFAD
jgi:hypothetical protein